VCTVMVTAVCRCGELFVTSAAVLRNVGRCVEMAGASEVDSGGLWTTNLFQNNSTNNLPTTSSPRLISLDPGSSGHCDQQDCCRRQSPPRPGLRSQEGYRKPTNPTQTAALIISTELSTLTPLWFRAASNNSLLLQPSTPASGRTGCHTSRPRRYMFTELQLAQRKHNSGPMRLPGCQDPCNGTSSG
jgi:hypothetical protein